MRTKQLLATVGVACLTISSAWADVSRVELNNGMLILEDIPRLSADNYNQARRFVTLIDALYEARVRLRYGGDFVVARRATSTQAKRRALRLARKLGWVVL